MPALRMAGARVRPAQVWLQPLAPPQQQEGLVLQAAAHEAGAPPGKGEAPWQPAGPLLPLLGLRR